MEHLQDENASIILRESALKKKCCVYRFTTHDNFQSIQGFLHVVTPLLRKIVNVMKDSDCSLTGHIQLCIQMIDEDYHNEDNTRKDIFYFSTKMTNIYVFNLWLNDVIASLNNKMDAFTDKSSGWIIDYIKFGEFRFIKV